MEATNLPEPVIGRRTLLRGLGTLMALPMLGSIVVFLLVLMIWIEAKWMSPKT